MINGKIHGIGRFPNSNSKQSFLKIEAVNGENVIKNSLLNGSVNWKGAEVVIQKNHWIIDREKIIDHSDDKLSFLPSSGYKARTNFGFFIQNHINTLDEFGEWYHDQNTGEIYIFFGEKDPKNYQIEIAIYEDIITTLTNTRHIVLNGLILEGANRHGVFLLGGDNFTILNCIIRNSGQDGIHALNNSNLSIRDSEIHESLNSGLNLKSGNQSCEVKNNTVSNTYLIAGMGQNGDNNGFGIYTISDHDVIKRNKVLNSGYIGIGFKGNGTLVAENFIKGFCMTKNDGGGIYTYTGKSNIEFRDRIIENNIVIQGVGNLSGTNLTPGLHRPQVEGIYIDDNASGVKITGNTIANIPNFGINIHNARKIEIIGNLIFDSGHSIHIGNDDRGKDIADLTIKNNKFITRTPGQYTLGFFEKIQRLPTISEISGNLHYNPFGNNQLIQIRTKEYQGQKNDISLDYMDWQKNWNIEREPTFVMGEFEYFETSRYVGPDLIGAEKISNKPVNVICTSGCDIAYSNNKIFDHGHLLVSHKNEQSTIKIDIGAVKKNSSYELKINAKANAELDAYIFLRYRKEPYTAISNIEKINLRELSQTYKIILNNYIDTPESSIIINHLADPCHYGVESISFREVETKKKNQNDFLQFEYNFTDSPKPVTSENTGITIKSSEKELVREIPPFSGAVFFLDR